MRPEPTRRGLLAGLGLAVLTACARTAAKRSTTAAVAQPGPTSPAGATAPSRPPSPSSAGAGSPRVLRRASSGRPEVALTFHGAGDPGLAEHLLGEAERAGAAVTVFAVGSWLVQNPGMAARVLKGGHALGNHTYTHPTLHRLSPTEIAAEVQRCADVLTRQTGAIGTAFRPSGGTSITAPMVAAAARSGYDVVLGFDVDPADYADPGQSAVARRVLSTVRAGSVVSLHLGHEGTVRALPAILDGLRQRGLAPVTVPVLLAAA